MNVVTLFYFVGPPPDRYLDEPGTTCADSYRQGHVL